MSARTQTRYLQLKKFNFLHSKKRNGFISFVFDINAKDVPAFIQKSSIIVMNKNRARKIIEGIEISYQSGERISLTELMPVSYFSENEEYPYGGNPGKIEPSIKITLPS